MKGQLLETEVNLAKKRILTYSEIIGAMKAIRRANHQLIEAPE